ncbi:MAG: hypothetical protein Q9170_005100 [Blastenia crenularia]
MESSHNVIVGIDFGTTYTAAAWADTSNRSQIEIIKNWPTAGPVVGSQVPSEICYDQGGRERVSWGYNIKPQSDKIKWFKLGLEIGQDMLTLPFDLTPAEVICDYLSAVRKHVINTLDRRIRRGSGQSVDVTFAVTVPAIWSDAARENFRQATVNAGMGRMSPPRVFSEPECAAIYTLKDLDDISSLHLNDHVLVCDAGGGTVDIITYEVASILPLSITECTVGTGDYCGSTFVDREFEKLFVTRMGHHYKSITPVHRLQAIKNFEATKAAFRDDPEQEVFYVNIPTAGDIEETGLHSGNLHITRDEMRSLFEPAINRILDLIRAQVKVVPSINMILLVGGFGESEYLYQRVLAWASGTQIRVIQPREASTAIARGAVMKALETAGHSKTRITRRSRKWYGVTINEPFIQGVHVDEDRYPDTGTGQVLARNQVRWFIRKNQTLSDEETFRHVFHRDFLYLGPWKDSLVSCTSDPPPSRLEPPVIKLCSITTDLTHLSKKHFARRWRRFQRYYTAHYTLCLGLRDNNLTFSLEFQGRQYSAASVEFD